MSELRHPSRSALRAKLSLPRQQQFATRASVARHQLPNLDPLGYGVLYVL